MGFLFFFVTRRENSKENDCLWGVTQQSGISVLCKNSIVSGHIYLYAVYPRTRLGGRFDRLGVITFS